MRECFFRECAVDVVSSSVGMQRRANFSRDFSCDIFGVLHDALSFRQMQNPRNNLQVT